MIATRNTVLSTYSTKSAEELIDVVRSGAEIFGRKRRFGAKNLAGKKKIWRQNAAHAQ